MSRILGGAVVVLLGVSVLAQTTGQPPQSNSLGSDPNGNPLRLAFKTGHVSNDDESKVRPYTLPDPLVLANGRPVRDANVWTKQRRAEILKKYFP